MGKRLFDIVSASLGLLILSPVIALISVLVKMDSPGPVFYRGVRTGRNGSPFQMLKFRTMVIDAERLGGPSTGKDDPRVTRLGNFLRRHKLDEIPQLFNVLKGDMSVVGPRPEVPQYTALYQGEERLILTVRPGITDWASLRFSRLADVLGADEPDRVYEEQVRPEKNRLRVRYVKEASFRNDLQIIWRTLLRILGRD